MKKIKQLLLISFLSWPFFCSAEQILDTMSTIQCVEDGIVDVAANINSPIDLSSNPQVAPIVPVGANPPICIIRGTSDIAAVKLDSGNGLDLPQGSIILGANDSLTLIWDADAQIWRSPNLKQATTDWKAILGLIGVSTIDVHDMVEFDNGNGKRLYLCGYMDNSAVVASYEPISGELALEFAIREEEDPGFRCRNIEVFKDKLYVSLGSNFSSLYGAGDVYRWDGGSTVTKVLDTSEGDMYALSTSLDGNKLYAGGGTVFDDPLPNGTAKLWMSEDGIQWQLLKDFGPEYEVVRWIAPDPDDNGRLYVSTRASANLWSTIDDVNFENHGAPPGMNAQIKAFTFHQGKMFLGGVAAGIWTFTRDPDTYTHLIDLGGMSKEVYHPDTCGDYVYFAARSNNAGGQVFQCNTEGCILIYADDAYSGAFHSILSTDDGSLYLGAYFGADTAPYWSKLRMSRCFLNPKSVDDDDDDDDDDFHDRGRF